MKNDELKLKLNLNIREHSEQKLELKLKDIELRANKYISWTKKVQLNY